MVESQTIDVRKEAQASFRGIIERYTGDPQRHNAAAQLAHVTTAVFDGMANGTVPPPQCAQLEITNRCSSGCRMCRRFTWTQSKHYTPDRELSASRQIELLQELGGMGVRTVVFSGGEPLTHPELESLLEAARGAGLRLGVLTNGVGITAAKAEALAAHADWVRISIDNPPQQGGPGFKTVRRLLQPFKEEESSIAEAVQRSIRNLKTARAKHRHSGLQIGFAYTMQATNVSLIREMVAYASEQGVIVTFKFAHGTDAPFLCSERQLRWLWEEILSDESIVRNPFVNIRYLSEYVVRSLGMKDVARGTPTCTYYEHTPIRCFTPFAFSLIDAFGGVYVCCHWYDDNGPLISAQREEHRVGDVSQESFASAWTSARYQQVRRSLDPINVRTTPCSCCTRHWIPNTIMTQLYEDVYWPLVEGLGPNAARGVYGQLVNECSSEGPVWL